MDKNRGSLKKSALLNTVRSIIAVIFPLITYPYAARVIGVDNIGKVNYVASYIEYFTLLAVFGMTAYAVRECAAYRDNRRRIDELASDYFSFNLVMTVISLVLMAVLVLVYGRLHSYAFIFLIQSLSVIFTALGMDWVNVVFEDYGYITLRGIIINILNMALLFILVHSPEDYLIYAFLNISTVVFIGIANFIYVRRYVTLRINISRRVLGLAVPLAPFFINAITIAIYVGADTTMLGIMRGDHYVGIYSVSVKIYTIVKSVFIAIFSVTLSRLSEHASAKEYGEFNNIISRLTSVFMLLGIPAMVGMIIYAQPIVLLVGGAEFAASAASLRLLAVALVFAIFGGIVTNCINVPLGYEKVNSRATIIAAAENILLNIPCILLWNEKGAALATIVAEATVLCICLFNLVKSNRIVLKDVIDLRHLRDSAVGAGVISVAFYPVHRLLAGSYAEAIVGIIVSVILYGTVMLVFRNSIVTDALFKAQKRVIK